MSREFSTRALCLTARLERQVISASSRNLLSRRFYQSRCQTLTSSLYRQGAPSTSISKQAFSTSQRRHAVQVTHPRQNDDGDTMLIDITPRAAKRLSEIMNKDNNPHLALRVTVESGGCHGFQYLMSLTNANEASAEDDVIFEADDGTGAKVILDEPSLDLLQGSKVDFTSELIGSQFKIVDNPRATSGCGCGTSFDVKI